MNAPLACDVSAPPSARDVRTDLPRWLALVHNGPDVTHNGMAPTLVGARVSRARPSPRSEPPHSVPRRGRAAGDVGPYHSPTRTHSAPTLAPQRPGARSTRAAPGAWRPNASGPVRWPRREGRNSVRPSTQARRPGRHGGPGSGQPLLRAHGAQGVRFQCVIKSYSWPES